MRFSRVLAACALLMALGGGLGQTARAEGLFVDDPGQIAIGAGGYNVFHNTYNSGVFRGEYRFAEKLFILRPIVGGEVNTTGGVYGYGGFSAEIGLGDRQQFVIIPSAAVGLWARGGRGDKKLGSFVEFRTGGEFDYRFEDGSRFGVSLHHISNAGLTKQNPGVEEALIVYTLPISIPFP